MADTSSPAPEPQTQPPPSTASANDDGAPSASTATPHHPPPLLSRISYLSKIYTTKSLSAPQIWYRDWKEYFYPATTQPDIIKTYECRPDLPVRIFFPSSYDLLSLSPLPTLFTIHGSVSAPFCLGDSRDDDEWNRQFADRNNVLVIGLDYSKVAGGVAGGGGGVFPRQVFDVEAGMLAALGDESLPIDRTSPRGGGDGNKKKGRVGVLGFGGAGGNLALGVVQLDEVRRSENCPGVVVSIGGWLDMAMPGTEKRARGGVTGEDLDVWKWGLLPYGLDLRDPIVSPCYVQEEELPEWRCFIGGERDVLAWENWALARRLAGKGEVKRGEGVCGREERGGYKKGLEREDEGFWFEEDKVKWVLVPDVGPGFEHREVREEMGWGEEVVKDAEEKTEEVMLELGGWLKRAWGVEG
ncbi:Alpha/Beta hydrolase protein [Apiosordaria backusii]|uniref:Alpha/Beta hydrolase protein n=1 Tax=Apiosordaria backusii TaxID=314023 RepID=A0AA40ASQ5_9PEZI|nr:Alpha/Beta hydrolase protein [Apiosordaria backusii]